MIKRLLELFRKPRKESHMQVFTKEYLDQLIAEHKLVSASIAHIQTGGNYARFVRNHSQDAVAAGLGALMAKRVELEAKIDVLQDYLD